MRTINLFLVGLLTFCSYTTQAQSDCTNDTTVPVAICNESLAVHVSAGDEVTLFAQDFDDGSQDDCSDVTLSFSADASVASMTVNANTASPISVVLYVTDEVGNQNTCLTSLTINADNQPCADDTIAPQAICDANVIVLLNANNEGTLNTTDLDDGSFDNCSQVILSFSETMIVTTMTLDENTASPSTISLFVTDSQGQQSSCFAFVTTQMQDCNNDTQNPTPYCTNDLHASVNDDGTAQLFATDFDAGSFDNCSDVQVSFSADVNDTVLSLTTDDIGTIEVTLWATDASNNQDFCTTYLILEDKHILTDLSGSVFSELGTGIVGVTVQARLAGTNAVVAQAITGTDGQYTLSDLNEEATYDLSVERDGNDLNGVTTFDGVMIRRHIVGLTPLPSQLRMIAADVNNSGSITTFDMIIIRRTILGITSSFGNTPSWKFLRSTVQFSNSQNPFEFAIISGNSFTIDITANNGTSVNFIGIKTGDVNGSVNP